VLLNGSRVNPNIKEDIFQDFDIKLLVSNVNYFKNENIIFSHFGKPELMQKPEDMDWPEPFNDGNYTYLMQFSDGIRIDLGICNVNNTEKFQSDSLTKVVLDKDDKLNFKAPSEDSYFIQKPSKKLFEDCCNEFYWGLGAHIPKSIWREDLILAKQMIEIVLRKPLLKILEWYVGINSDFEVSFGKGGKNLKQYLDVEDWKELEKTYSDSNYENIWNSLFSLHILFKKFGIKVGKKLNYNFPVEDSEKALNILRTVKDLSKNAKSIY